MTVVKVQTLKGKMVHLVKKTRLGVKVKQRAICGYRPPYSSEGWVAAFKPVSCSLCQRHSADERSA